MSKPALPQPKQPMPKKASAPVIASKPAQRPSNKKDRLYIVQDGDTLWKISRRFNVDIAILRDHNKLRNDALKPGTPIRIP